jgi:hypothetical protein
LPPRIIEPWVTWRSSCKKRGDSLGSSVLFALASAALEAELGCAAEIETALVAHRIEEHTQRPPLNFILNPLETFADRRAFARGRREACREIEKLARFAMRAGAARRFSRR